MYVIDPYLTSSGDGMVPSGDPFSVYPGKDGPVASLRALNFKDALQDADILKAASETASEILSLDADLSLPQNEELQRRLSAYMKEDLQNLGL